MDAVAALPSSPGAPLPTLQQRGDAPLMLDLESAGATEDDDDAFEILAPFVPGTHRGSGEEAVDDELAAEDALVRSLLEPDVPSLAPSPRRPLTPRRARSSAQPAAPAPNSDPFGFRRAPKHLARPRDRTPEAPIVAPPLSPASSASYISYVVTPPRRPPSPVPVPPQRHEPSTPKKSVAIKQVPCNTADLVDELPRRRARAVKSDRSDIDDDERYGAAVRRHLTSADRRARPSARRSAVASASRASRPGRTKLRCVTRAWAHR